MTLDIDSIRKAVRSEAVRSEAVHAMPQAPDVRGAVWLLARDEFADAYAEDVEL
ncbi:MAG: hypothetical protein IAE81_15135 [Caldilineaceae bacterium]|jgi:hypothetical protein|nr:hypothetical protein [Caldilineaceae bacterium]